MLDKFKYELLICINNCQDTYVPKIVIFNILKWDYSKLNDLIDILVNEKLLNTMDYKDTTIYSVSPLGKDFINEYSSKHFIEISKHKTTSSKSNSNNINKINSKHLLHTLYIAPIIVGVILLILGIILNSLLETT